MNLSPTWKHYLGGGLMLLAGLDELASQWLAAGHTLPFHLTAVAVAAAGWWITAVEKSIIGSSDEVVK